MLTTTLIVHWKCTLCNLKLLNTGMIQAIMIIYFFKRACIGQLREKKIKEEGHIKQREKVRIVKRIQNLHLIKRVLIPAKQISWVKEFTIFCRCSTSDHYWNNKTQSIKFMKVHTINITENKSPKHFANNIMHIYFLIPPNSTSPSY
jgi:hypothetical protein